MPATDHTDCTIADAAAGAVTAVCVIHDVKGHSAMRPPTPTNSSTDATTRDLTVHPGLVCSTGTSVSRVCVPYREYSHAIPLSRQTSVKNGSARATRARAAGPATPHRLAGRRE